ncbi:MAG: hypothetical protein INR69_02120 [Mucilaginibacter polytrichastri]|nr:hypothetical protein [Mucilaginibacter polytrichastri]
MKRIVALIVVLLLAVAAAAYFYFASLRSNTSGYSQLLEAIPGDAVFAYSFTNEKEYSELFRSNNLFTSVTGGEVMEQFRAIRNFTDGDALLKKATTGKPVFLTLHVDTLRQKMHWMLLTAPGNDVSWNELLAALRKRGTIRENASVSSYDSRELGAPCYFTRRKGLLAISFSADAISSFERGSGEASSFIHLSDQQNRNALAGLLINYRMLPKLGRILSSKKNGQLYSMLPGVGGSSATTLSYSENALIFNGISRTDPRTDAFMPLLAGQRPVRLNIDRFLPLDATAYTAVGLSRYADFERKLDSLQSGGDFSGRKAQLQKQVSFNLSQLMRQQFGGEFAVALMPNGEKIGFIRIRNGMRFRQFLSSLSESGDDSEEGRLRYEALPQAFFGPHFSVFRRPYFALNDNYLVLCNQRSLLDDYIRQKKNNRTLGSSETYQRHKKLMADQGNLSFYMAFDPAQYLLRTELKPDVYRVLNDDKQPSLSDFDGLSIQFSADHGDFYTTICLRADQQRRANEEAAWTYNTGARLSSAPQVMPNLGGRTVIMAQDALNRLHLFSDSGNRITQKTVSGKIRGEIHRYGNGLLFVTNNRLYYTLADGSDQPGFPVSLDYPATSDLLVFNDQIIIPTGNGLRAYDKEGNEISEWQHNLTGTVRFPPVEANISGQKRLALLTESGRFYVFDEQGTEVKTARLPSGGTFPFPYALRSGNTDSSAFLITADKEGRVYRAAFDGSTDSVTVGIFTGEISFDCINISGDAQPELIFLNEKQLTVYNADNVQMYNYLFPVSVKQTIGLVSGRGMRKIGIQAKSGKGLYLFNDDGTLTAGFPFEGSSPFWSGDLYGNGRKFIILNEGLSVKAYVLR